MNTWDFKCKQLFTFLLVPYLKGMSQKFLESSMHPLEYLFHSDIAVFGIFIT